MGHIFNYKNITYFDFVNQKLALQLIKSLYPHLRSAYNSKIKVGSILTH